MTYIINEDFQQTKNITSKLGYQKQGISHFNKSGNLSKIIMCLWKHMFYKFLIVSYLQIINRKSQIYKLSIQVKNSKQKSLALDMSQQTNHQLRLSIDLRSIKDHEFTAHLYIKYNPIPDLGIKPFRSTPSIPVNNPKNQLNLTANCFATGYFEAGPGEVQPKLDTELKIQLWHNDRLKKDILLGIAKISLKQVLTVPLRKKQESFARVLDAYIPVDQIDEDQNPTKKIAAIRVLVYLQDLGPVDLLKQKGFDIKDLINQDQDRVIQDPKLPSENQQIINYEGINQQRMQLNELQYKVVWQLQTWKKAEEAKTRITLKQKEIQFWTNLSQQQRKSDIEKQKHFKKIQANLNLLETKLKAKMSELSKREQKIIIYEQQLQNKITEVSKQCLHKDEQIERVRRKAKEEKTGMTKQKSMLELEISKFRAQNAKLRVQLQEAKKVDERSPLNLLKQQFNTKCLQIKELSRQLQKCNEVKQQYKLYYEKMKNEVISLREKLKEKEESLREQKYEKDLLINNYKNLQQKLNYEMANRNKQQHQYYQQPVYDLSYEDEDLNQEGNYRYLSERDRLIKARQDLIDQGLYSPNDELIKQYDRNIASMS